MKKLIFFVSVLIIVGAGFYYYMSRAPASVPSAVSEKAVNEIRLTPRQQMTREQAAKVKEIPLAPEVERILEKKMEGLTKFLSTSTALSEIRAANEANKNLSMSNITALDDAWIASKSITPFIEKILTNKISSELMVYKESTPGLNELFVTDIYGLNVGQTGKTSDYYQADEAWWVNSFNGGVGMTFHGNIEFDKSSQTEAISIYLPIIDPSTQNVIGVLKGVFDVSSIKSEL